MEESLAALPKDITTFRGILRDQTGLGQTKQILLMLALRAAFTKQEDPRPTVIAVPAGLVTQWRKEITENWSGFEVFICYGGDDVPTFLENKIIRAAHLKSLDHLDRLPETIRFLLSKGDKNERKARSIILTSYETWSERTVYEEDQTKITQKGEIRYKQYRYCAGAFNGECMRL